MQNVRSLTPGMVLSGCRILEKLGEGGMGTVYKARDENLDRLVAVKILHQSSEKPDVRERFLREAKMLAGFRHPGIVQLFSYGEHRSFPYFIMELIDGSSLESYLSRVRLVSSGQLKPEDIENSGVLDSPETPYFLRTPFRSPLNDEIHFRQSCRIICSLADSLHELHCQGIIHRDIKPSNILICRNGEIKIVDFGLAKKIPDPDLTRPGQVMGTLNYLAPEAFYLKNPVLSFSADIYSLGVVFYELLTLVKPVEETDFPLFLARVTKGDFPSPRTFNPVIPDDIDAFIMRCLAKNPENRFSSMEQLSTELRRSTDETQIFSGIRNFFSSLFRKTPEYFPRDNQKKNPGEINERKYTKISLEDREKALELYEKALKLFMESFTFDRSLKLLREALDIDLSSINCCYLLVIVSWTLGESSDVEKRVNDARNCISQISADDEIRLLILEKFCEKEYSTVSLLISDYLERHPDDIEVLLLSSQTWMVTGNYPEASDNLLKIICLRPEFNVPYLYLSTAKAALGDFDQASEILEKRLSLYPELVNLRLISVQQLTGCGRLDEAQKHLDLILRENPFNDLGLLFQARLMIRRGEKKRAADILMMLVDMLESDYIIAYLYFMLYRIAKSTGDSSLASEYLKKAQKNPEWNFHDIDEMYHAIETADLSLIISRSFRDSELKLLRTYTKKACRESLDLSANTRRGALSTVSLYGISDNDCNRLTVYTDFFLDPEQDPQSQIMIGEIPFYPFTDHLGNALSVSYHKCISKFGRFAASLRYESVSGSGEPVFFFSESDAGNLIKKGKKIFELQVIFSCNRYHAVLIRVPANIRYSKITPQPSSEIRLEKSVVFIYEGYFNISDVLKISLFRQRQ